MLWPMIAMGAAPLVSKFLGRMFGPKYPKFDYNYQLPQFDWAKHYNTMMGPARQEASRFSQAAAARSLPGGPNIAAQAQIGQQLGSQSNQLLQALSAQKLGYEIPWAQQQQGWKREDMLRKYAMGQQDWQDIMGGATGALGYWAGNRMGGGVNPWQELLNMLRQGGYQAPPNTRQY